MCLFNAPQDLGHQKASSKISDLSFEQRLILENITQLLFYGLDLELLLLQARALCDVSH